MAPLCEVPREGGRSKQSAGRQGLGRRKGVSVFDRQSFSSGLRVWDMDGGDGRTPVKGTECH